MSDQVPTPDFFQNAKREADELLDLSTENVLKALGDFDDQPRNLKARIAAALAAHKPPPPRKFGKRWPRKPSKEKPCPDSTR